MRTFSLGDYNMCAPFWIVGKERHRSHWKEYRKKITQPFLYYHFFIFIFQFTLRMFEIMCKCRCKCLVVSAPIHHFLDLISNVFYITLRTRLGLSYPFIFRVSKCAQNWKKRVSNAFHSPFHVHKSIKKFIHLLMSTLKISIIRRKNMFAMNRLW
jgi:hypothetical protein